MTSSQPPVIGGMFKALLDNVDTDGVTVVIASHDLALISRMQHRILTLRQGRLIAQAGGS